VKWYVSFALTVMLVFVVLGLVGLVSLAFEYLHPILMAGGIGFGLSWLAVHLIFSDRA
jgi:hypothetical protein